MQADPMTEHEKYLEARAIGDGTALLDVLPKPKSFVENQRQVLQPKAKPSATVILNNALTQVEEVLAKAESTHQLLQQNLQQVTQQRIGLQYQKSMLTDLIAKIQQSEK